MALRLAVARGMPTLAERYRPAANGFGLIRLTLAAGVLIAHSWPLGFGKPSPGATFSRGQVELGSLSVKGFFLVSGFLIAGSALRHSWSRYVWHRFLRIMPAFWVCLVVTALGFAPVAALIENGGLAGFWTHPQGPWQYLGVNVFAAMDQYPISGLLSGIPFGDITGGPSAFNGSLWTLRYELALYALIAAASLTAVLHRAARALALVTAGLFALMVREQVINGWTFRPAPHGAVQPLPLLGSFTDDQALYLGFMFLLGCTARLYPRLIPMHGHLALVAAGVLLISLVGGGFYTFGLPAYGYLLLFAAVAMPRRLTRIGRTHDYSYGVYIYAFPVQQTLVLIGAAGFGLAFYLASSLAGTAVLAVASWHLIERPALRLRDVRVTPAIRRGEPAFATGP